jgi:hypothetical protein
VRPLGRGPNAPDRHRIPAVRHDDAKILRI